MQCPKCSYYNTKVYDTRTAQNSKAIRRRRECIKCSYRFTTLEEVRVLDLKVEKRNGQVVDFEQEKLEVGVKKAFNKRSVNNQKVAQVVQKTIEDILALDKNPVKSTRIGRIVLKNLKNMDEAAYICFAAMYLNFDSITDFNKVLKELQKD